MIEELKRFIIIIEVNSFTRASEKLFITQPALSLSIKRLEKEIGVKLFKRIGKKFILTKDGEAIHQIGLQILKLWLKIKDPSFRIKTNTPFYSIGLFDNAALKLSKYFQKNFARDDFHFEIIIDRSATLTQGIQNGVYDLCICIINAESKIKENVKLVKIFREKLLPVSSKKWKKEIAKVPFILYNKESVTRDYIDQVFFKNSIKPNIIVESTNPGFMKELAIGGCGVALLPKNFVERELTQKKLFVQNFPFNFQREIGLLLSKEGSLKESDELVREIIENLK
ncbi:LysR family transcriptional regulator [Candidatus Microgenomates bacterium]|nr:MAG: LysR family transcriptional regulator [Candidatus Microgenomates bacterium]